jgi:hypothetical protein
MTTNRQLSLISLPNHYQAQTSVTKLHGQYYTPPQLVRLMLNASHAENFACVIDPSCGDGGFLRGVVELLATLGKTPDEHADLAALWIDRLIGFDIDVEAVTAARQGVQRAFLELLGVDVSPTQIRIYHADPLEHRSLASLFEAVGLSARRADEKILIVGNPPYVEAKRLATETKCSLRQRFPDALVGAPDLYLYFVNACLNWLRPQDRLAFVLPNKLLVNANAQRIRERLLTNNHLTTIWFATQAQIFPDAAVYPIVLFAQGHSATAIDEVEVRNVTRENEVLSLDPPYRVSRRLYRHTTAHAFFPLPTQPLLRSLLERLTLSIGDGRLSELLDIRWSVSFHRRGLRDRFVAPEQPTTRTAQRFLGGGAFSGNGEVSRYGIQWAGWWIDYDEDRLRSEGNVVPELTLFTQPKIVICQNGRTIRAAFDERGYVLKDTFLCGVVQQATHPLAHVPLAILGLLSSRLMHFFYSHVFYGGHVNGGYLHFLRSFLIDLPLGTWDGPLVSEVDTLVRARLRAPHGDAQQALEDRIEDCIERAFSVSGDERMALRDWAASDENWRARNRIRPPHSPHRSPA